MVALSVFYYWAARDYYQRHQPTSVYRQPRFLYPIIGAKNNKLVNPLGVHVAFGSLYTTSADKVVVTSREGAFNWSLNLSGDAQKIEDISSRSVVLDRFGRIYVSAGPKNDILVYRLNGDFRYIFPQLIAPVKTSNSTTSKKVINPVGLRYFDDQLYVTDVGDQTLKIFSTTGKLKKKIGGPGTTPGKFQYPNSMVKAGDGTLYVTDSNNSRVQVFDKNGKFLSFLKAPEKDMFSLPRGIDIDKLGRIHVVDTLKSRVYVFSKDHKFLFTYGSSQNNEGDLAYPNGIYIDQETGLIFIADRLNNRVAVWAEK